MIAWPLIVKFRLRGRIKKYRTVNDNKSSVNYNLDQHAYEKPKKERQNEEAQHL